MDQNRKELLIALSRIVRSNCYNGNIQNYARWGERESEGRWFTYPEKHVDHNNKAAPPPDNLHVQPPGLLRAVYCAFGANKLFVYRAIDQLLSYLEKHHLLEISDYEVRQREAREKADRRRREHEAHITEIATAICNSAEGSSVHQLLVIAKETEFQRTCSLGELDEKTAKCNELNSAVEVALQELAAEFAPLTRDDVVAAADRALGQIRQKEFDALMARCRVGDEKDGCF